MTRDLKFETFKSKMKNKTKKIINECDKSRLDEEDSTSLDFYEEIRIHLYDYVFDEGIEEEEVENYNLAYNELEKMYMNYLKTL